MKQVFVWNLKAAPTEIFTFGLSRLQCSRLLVNHNGMLNTKNNSLYAEILPWTRMQAWPFWCPPRRSTLLIWYSTRVLAQCIVCHMQ
ncbi:hypothetical protein Y032_0035g3129 [Ancylostoma ceylanicum]|uniref:Uncharacterized protein n=1 Tax=Ancylostoma ceylanicum TaxID=53326 RepID=A0A016UME1_9BILA|nr:hypothetical protein Y032_0035g3129 [Ancylostoma ceylanicum]